MTTARTGLGSRTVTSARCAHLVAHVALLVVDAAQLPAPRTRESGLLALDQSRNARFPDHVKILDQAHAVALPVP
jgi:hypothetical protein